MILNRSDFKLLLATLFIVDNFRYSSEDAADNNAGIVAKFSNSLVPHLFKALSTDNENLVFSPFGLAANLIMAIEATDKSSANEIIELFKLGKNRMKLKRGFKALNEEFLYDSLKDDLAGVFSRVSVVTSQPLASAFEDTIRNYFQANITFASNDTSGQSGLDDFPYQGLQLESETGVVSHWQDYQKLAVYTYLSHNPSAIFHSASNGTMRVPMIPQIGVFRGGYVAQIKSYIVELKLQTNCMRLVLMMPNVTSHSGEELQKLSFRSGLDELLNVIPPKEMEVLLPQLATIKKDIDFVEFLRNFGVSSIFSNSTHDDGAKGGSANKSNVYIESIKQNAYFSTSFTTVNSGSAIESNLRSRTSTRTKRQVKARLVFNKPFLFYLMHCKHGLILLAGKVFNPTQVPSR